MDPIAVIDVETTGLNPYRYDRIVEVAIVLLDPSKGITLTADSLVNPERDIGPSSIHGVTATDVVDAPAFGDIAAHIADVLRPVGVLAGHNLRFDISFLSAEYRRIGVDMPIYATLDTMALAGGGTLSACCCKHGIPFQGQSHAALDDARTTAMLLLRLLSQCPDILEQCRDCSAPVWPRVQPAGKPLVSRSGLRQLHDAAPRYIQRLARTLSPSSAQSLPAGAERDYRALLWNVLEDGRVDEQEGDALVEVATRWGLSFARVREIHLDYLVQLAREAWADRYLSEAERAEIQVAARLLGLGKLSETQLRELLISTEKMTAPECRMSANDEWRGRTVCFTGEHVCSIGGTGITRTAAERMATDNGLQVVNAVTKKLDILVVADPNTQSGKARKARAYGIRIIHEPRFWRELGIAVD